MEVLIKATIFAQVAIPFLQDIARLTLATNICSVIEFDAGKGSIGANLYAGGKNLSHISVS
jgi:hypothetical protein